MNRDESGHLGIHQIRRCFEGVIPAVVATASADGTPNVTYLSRVREVDDDHVALSNQFFSKTTRNLAENPRASMLLIDPITYDEYRLTLVYERTERRGAVFERLRDDVDALAALEGMQDVFKLRAADVYRVLQIDRVVGAIPPLIIEEDRTEERANRGARLAELTARLGRSADLDTLVGATVDGLAELLGYEHSLLMLVDEQGGHLFTIASHGYDAEGVGSEVPVGEGVVGMAAARCTPIRIGNVRQMGKYSRTVRRSFEGEGEIAPGREIPVPGLADAESRVAVPVQSMGRLVGVLMVESREKVAFDQEDDAALAVIASLLGNAIELARLQGTREDIGDERVDVEPEPEKHGSIRVRFFTVDGSTFLDGDYLIKGVAGRILWSLLQSHAEDGRVDFTNREVRLDPSLELPEFRDNFESRLILLKRRLEERHAPVQIEKTGRGRFRLHVESVLELDAVSDRSSSNVR